MKKIISFLVILAIALASPLLIFAAEGNTVLVMKGNYSPESRDLDIVVSVKENSGVSSMLLSLVYDTSAVTLTGITYGSAFSTLSPIHTNTDTAEGYGVYPFKITYLGEENDTSIGEMMTLHFRVKDDAPDGKYIIDLEYTRDQDVTYLADNKIRTKNLLIDSAEITLSGSKITNVDTIPDDSPQKSQADDQSILWFVAAIFGTVMISGSCILIPMWLKRKKAKKWKRI